MASVMKLLTMNCPLLLFANEIESKEKEQNVDNLDMSDEDLVKAVDFLESSINQS